jgi:hypothetical protein
MPVFSLFLVVVILCAGCGPTEDPARVELRRRLMAPERLSEVEMGRLMRETVNTLSARPVRVREGDGTRTLDEAARAEVLAVLTGNLSVEDVGLRKEGELMLRGISGPGTPRDSELDAAQTLWIDVQTFLPRRFDLVYSLPGFGDHSYDLVISP